MKIQEKVFANLKNIVTEQSLQSKIQQWDYKILKMLNQRRNPVEDKIATFISGSIYPVSVIVPLIAFYYNRKKGEAIGLSVLIQYALAHLVKIYVNRSRPYETYTDIQNSKVVGDPSFVSGHSSTAAALALSLLFNEKSYFSLLGGIYTFYMAYARIYLGLHYPTDTLGGIATGFISALIAQKIIF